MATRADGVGPLPADAALRTGRGGRLSGRLPLAIPQGRVRPSRESVRPASWLLIGQRRTALPCESGETDRHRPVAVSAGNGAGQRPHRSRLSSGATCGRCWTTKIPAPSRPNTGCRWSSVISRGQDCTPRRPWSWAAPRGRGVGAAATRAGTACTRAQLDARAAWRLSAASLAVLAAGRTASAAVPAALIHGTLKAALLFAAGKAVVGAASVRAVAWTQGVLRADDPLQTEAAGGGRS